MLVSAGSALTFDWTISVGNLIMMVSLLAGGIYAVATVKFDMRLIGARVQRAESDLSTIVAKMDQVTNVMITIAQQDERIKALDNRVTLLSSMLESKRIATGT